MIKFKSNPPANECKTLFIRKKQDTQNRKEELRKKNITNDTFLLP